MCDYSLMHKLTRDARVGDELVTKNFGYTTGMCDAANAKTEDTTSVPAVCLKPGTEVAFHAMPAKKSFLASVAAVIGLAPAFAPKDKVAIFKQIDTETLHIHHDAFEFPDGQTVKINDLEEGQGCTVLQLPAEPKNESEAKEQERLEIVA